MPEDDVTPADLTAIADELEKLANEFATLMENIDHRLYECEQKIRWNENDIYDLQSRVGSLESKVSNLEYRR